MSIDSAKNKLFDYDYQVELQGLWATKVKTLETKVYCVSCNNPPLLKLDPRSGPRAKHPGRIGN